VDPLVDASELLLVDAKLKFVHAQLLLITVLPWVILTASSQWLPLAVVLLFQLPVPIRTQFKPDHVFLVVFALRIVSCHLVVNVFAQLNAHRSLPAKLCLATLLLEIAAGKIPNSKMVAK
jgi:hypothetical protein